MRYLLDTDTVNYLLRTFPQVSSHYEEALRNGAQFILCPVVDYEVNRYLLLKGAVTRKAFYDDLILRWERTDINQNDWDTAIELWAKRHAMGRPIADADLLIAVCALKSGAVLITNNTGHFNDLGLTVENWTQAAA
jgi:predicted nucleic acid-binding protein